MKTRILLGALVIFTIIVGYIGLFFYSEHLFSKFLDGKIDLEIKELTFEGSGRRFKITEKESIAYFKERLKKLSNFTVGPCYRMYACYVKSNNTWTKRLDVILDKNKRDLTVGDNDVWYGTVFDKELPGQIKDLVEFLSK